MTQVGLPCVVIRGVFGQQENTQEGQLLGVCEKVLVYVI